MSIVGLNTKLTYAESAIKRAMQAFEAAGEKYRADMARYDANWKKTLQPEAYREQVEQTEKPWNDAEQAANDAFEEARAVIDKVRTIAKADDGLTDEQRKEAEKQAFFVRETALDMPVDHVLKEIDAVLAIGDRVKTFLYHRYVTMRLDRLESPTGQQETDNQRRARIGYRKQLRDAHERLQTVLTSDKYTPLLDKAAALEASFIELGKPLAQRRQKRIINDLYATGRYGRL